MSHTVFCQRLKKELDGLENPPFPGEMGKKIFKSISKEAWQNWLSLQVMLINENNLSLFEQKAQEFLNQSMEDYLFNGIEIELNKTKNNL